MAKAKPFVKWAGGKGQLLPQLMEHLPRHLIRQKEFTYIEPFVGGGAMLFHMLQTFPNITKAVINDINPDLITCYKTIRDYPYELLETLYEIQERYYQLSDETRQREFFWNNAMLLIKKVYPPSKTQLCSSS